MTRDDELREAYEAGWEAHKLGFTKDADHYIRAHGVTRPPEPRLALTQMLVTFNYEGNLRIGDEVEIINDTTVRKRAQGMCLGVAREVHPNSADGRWMAPAGRERLLHDGQCTIEMGASRLWAEPAPKVPQDLYSSAPLWKCSNKACPDREPIGAQARPKCYTCDRPMDDVGQQLTKTAKIHELAKQGTALALGPHEKTLRQAAKAMNFGHPPVFYDKPSTIAEHVEMRPRYSGISVGYDTMIAIDPGYDVPTMVAVAGGFSAAAIRSGILKWEGVEEAKVSNGDSPGHVIVEVIWDAAVLDCDTGDLEIQAWLKRCGLPAGVCLEYRSAQV